MDVMHELELKEVYWKTSSRVLTEALGEARLSEA